MDFEAYGMEDHPTTLDTSQVGPSGGVQRTNQSQKCTLEFINRGVKHWRAIFSVPRYRIQSEACGSLVPESLEPRPNLEKSDICFATASTPTSKP